MLHWHLSDGGQQRELLTLQKSYGNLTVVVAYRKKVDILPLSLITDETVSRPEATTNVDGFPLAEQ